MPFIYLTSLRSYLLNKINVVIVTLADMQSMIYGIINEGRSAAVATEAVCNFMLFNSHRSLVGEAPLTILFLQARINGGDVIVVDLAVRAVALGGDVEELLMAWHRAMLIFKPLHHVMMERQAVVFRILKAIASRSRGVPSVQRAIAKEDTLAPGSRLPVNPVLSVLGWLKVSEAF